MHVKVVSFVIGGTNATKGENQTIKQRKKRPRSIKAFSLESIQVRLIESINQLERPNDDNDKHYGLFVWPCALVLAQFVAFYNTSLFSNRVVLELGCGTSLPGIVAALCGNVKKVFLSDRPDSNEIERNVQANMDLNKITDITTYRPFDWGSLDLIDHLDWLEQVDIVLAADCFYQNKDFENVLTSIAIVFRNNPRCKFYTTYQLRRYRIAMHKDCSPGSTIYLFILASMNRTIAPLLDRWKMQARWIPYDTFVGLNEPVDGADSIYLYEIQHQDTHNNSN